MRTKQKRKRLTAFLLSAVILFSSMGTVVFANGGEEKSVGNPITLDPKGIVISETDCQDGCEGHLLTGTTSFAANNSKPPVITIQGGTHTLILDDFSFTEEYAPNNTGASKGFSEFLLLEDNAQVTVQLKGNNSIKMSEKDSRGQGITVPSGSSLHLEGQDRISSVLKISTDDAVGIGTDNYDESIGNVSIENCNLDISIYPYSYSAAIGGNFKVNNGSVEGKIQILNSRVTTNGSIGQSYHGGGSTAQTDGWDISIESSEVLVNKTSTYCAAIGGGGCSNSYTGVNQGKIFIKDSNVTTKSASTSWYGAGIGGAMGQGCGAITIENSAVVTQGNNGAAGIGGGWSEVSTSSGINQQATPPTCGDITIKSSTVTAVGGANGAGIGGGEGGDAGNIYISEDSNVTATAGGSAAAIGGGYALPAAYNSSVKPEGHLQAWGGQAGEIVIEGSTVKAEANNGAGIGTGSVSSSFDEEKGHDQTQIYVLDVTIDGSSVTATSQYGAGVGYGKGWSKASSTGNQDQVCILSGTVVASSSAQNTTAYGLDVGEKGTILVAGGSVKARGVKLSEGSEQSTSVGVTNGNENGNQNTSVSERVITLTDKANQQIQKGDSIESGLTWSANEMAVTMEKNKIPYHYGMSQVVLDGDGNFYVYLPKNEKTYRVLYEFDSGTQDKDLPMEITDLLPTDPVKYTEGSTITSIEPDQVKFEVSDGVWKFQGYDADAKIANAQNVDENGNVIFKGVWTFSKTTAPIDPMAAVYKVEHYQQQDDGSYKLSDADFPLYGEIGETVIATTKSYDGYSVNNEKSTLSGVVVEPVMEDGEVKYLVLKVYYDKDKAPAPPVDPEPEEPKPEDPSNPSTPDTESPQTGDNSNLWFWFVLLAVSATGTGVTLFIAKRRGAHAKTR